jgi:hypothetical protein
MMPMPPSRAIAVAIRPSVHQGVFAETTGTARRIRGVSIVLTSTSLRLGARLRRGINKTSSKDRPSPIRSLPSKPILPRHFASAQALLPQESRRDGGASTIADRTDSNNPSAEFDTSGPIHSTPLSFSKLQENDLEDTSGCESFDNSIRFLRLYQTREYEQMAIHKMHRMTISGSYIAETVRLGSLDSDEKYSPGFGYT